MFSVKYQNNIIEFEIKYRERKTLAIQIEPPDRITVLSPSGLSERIIEEKVRLKGEWILKKINEFKSIDYQVLKNKFTDGTSIIYLGKYHPLKIIKNGKKKPKVNLIKGKFYIETCYVEDDLLKKAMESWYRKAANIVINQRVDFYKNIIRREPNLIKIKEQKRRWGSCTSDGNIYFNWRCIMAPLNIIDYIVVHELSHLVHRDHSGRFWHMVELVLPDYRERRKWLKRHGIKIDI